jgi:hypothetical protein
MGVLDKLRSKTKIIVSDAMPSSGKTTKIIEQMANDKCTYIYATPTLSECHRIAGTHYLEKDELKQPLKREDGQYEKLDKTHPLYSKYFKHPEYNNENGKLGSLYNLIEYGENIVTTHSLFEMLDENTLNLLNQLKGIGKGYKLVLDETLGVWSTYNKITRSDLIGRINDGICTVAEDGLITWNESIFSSKDSKYQDFAEKCRNKQIYFISKRVMYYEIPSHLFDVFQEVHILTYMFEHSELACFLRICGIEYTINKWGKTVDDIIPLIHILDHDKLNNLSGDLSFTQLKSDKKDIDNGVVQELRKAIHNLYSYVWPVPTQFRLWTTGKTVSSIIGNKRYNKSFLCFNTRGTNDYKHTTHLAYLLSVYMNPFLVRFLDNRGDGIDEEMYALSSMLQWIFRSAIRDGQEIYLYVPSVRMRGILLKYLNGQYSDII